MAIPLLVVPQGNSTINPTLMPGPYNVPGDFVPVASMGRAANVIVVNPQVPAKTIQELVAVQAVNSIQLLPRPADDQPAPGRRVVQATSRVPTSCTWPTGLGAGLNDALGGTIPMLIANMPTVAASYVQSGKLRAPGRDRCHALELPAPMCRHWPRPVFRYCRFRPGMACWLQKNTPPEVVKQLAGTSTRS